VYIHFNAQATPFDKPEPKIDVSAVTEISRSLWHL